MSQQNLSENEQDVTTLPLCPEGSPAKMSAMQENAQVSMAAGPLWFMNKSGYSTISNQIMLYLRTSQDFVEEDLQKCSEKLPRSGMMRNGILYELPDLEHPINEKESSSLPTPLGASMNPAAHGQVNGEWKTKINRMLSLLPTPRASESDQGPVNREKMIKSGSSWIGQKRGATVSTIIAMLPTPTCRDYKGGTIARVQAGNPKRALDCEMQCRGLKLQPAFVEWMQGFPIGWTVSDASEMRSSRSKSTRSSKPSRILKEEHPIAGSVSER